MDAGVQVGREVVDLEGDGRGKGEGYVDGLREMWAWAPGEANRVARGYTWGGGEEEEGEDEGEGEESGEEEEEEDGEGDDEAMEVDEEGSKDEGKNKGPSGQRILGVEEVMRFMMSGRTPVGAAAVGGR